MDTESEGSSNPGSGGGGGGGGGFGSLFRSTVSGMSPLSPYLNVDPKYLIQDADEFILPTGANKTRGRFELAFFTIGSCCMTGALFGAINGLRLGLTETRNMAWSKPRNVQILNLVTRQGATWANTLGSVALLYSVFGVIIEKTRGAEDDLNTMAAGTMTGVLYKSPGRMQNRTRPRIKKVVHSNDGVCVEQFEEAWSALLYQDCTPCTITGII
ncbi:mitochondrial import inner membrane translocase subunit Tim23B isoform X3 [Ictalurus punctatus]|uniref:Mitochondrial import inner membrane translocase subunit Tim23B isoform X3 n=1 Tax=Ictalurus punctatus TaxID=7998 RepID=A0A2D0QLQ4_ICTPU|nr:mitochondrial import inner membrane translocase subunit Tim23B isoform X3 [Ictalurus punctatus]